MITYSDRAVFPPDHADYVEGQHPTLDDIAIGLSRTMRFGGQTPHLYSVLVHSLVVARLVAQIDERFVIYGLLHDGHEAVVGDVPTPWKSKGQLKAERHLDALMRKALDLPEALPEGAAEVVKQADDAALRAEAHALGHRRAQRYWPREEFSDLAEGALQLTQDNVASGLTQRLLSDQQTARQVFIQNVQANMPGADAAKKLAVPGMPSGRVAPGKRA